MIDIEIPGYKIEKELGRGGMAAVYLAMQESMQRLVALKVMLPQLAASDPSFSERFLREARIVAQLSHPNIIAVFDVGVAGNYHYFSMEYHTGGDLKQKIKQGVTVQSAFSIAKALASALDYAHGKGYIHRDMKPENVLFRHDGSPVLTDFGIAKAHDSTTRMTATGAVVGTPHYMSPEQAQGQELDNRSDLYSLGVVIYEMLVGIVPYQGTSALSIGIKHLKEPVPQLPASQQQFQPLVDRLLAKNPDERFQSGAEMIRAIDALLSGQNIPDTAGAATVVAGAVDTNAATIQMAAAATGAETRVTIPPTQVTQAGQNKSGGLATVLGVVLLLGSIGGGAWWYLNQPESALAPVAQNTTSPALPDNTAEIGQLLAQAKTAIAENRRLKPENNNALYFYRQALSLDAGNAAARTGLTDLSSYYVRQAEDAIENKKLEDAEALLTIAEEIDATNPLIFSRRLALREAQEKQAAANMVPDSRGASLAREREAAKAREAEQRKAAEARQREETEREQKEAARREAAKQEARRRAREQQEKVDNLIAQADTYLAPGSLSNTRIALANDLYQQAIQLAPTDSRARQGKQKVANAYLAMATTQLEQKEYDAADRSVSSGLNVQPAHAGLLSLKAQIAEARSKPKRRTFGGF